jgi:hypothetical protein
MGVWQKVATVSQLQNVLSCPNAFIPDNGIRGRIHDFSELQAGFPPRSVVGMTELGLLQLAHYRRNFKTLATTDVPQKR